MRKTLGIIIPVYNEAENIGSTIEAIEGRIKTPHRIYIVYDFDEDNTLPVAEELLKTGIDIRFIKNPEQGVVNAIKTGLNEAGEDYLLVSMADLSDDYSVVDSMCRLMSEGYDIVCGSRYMRGGRQIGGPVIKRTLSRLAGVSLRYIAGVPTHDATNSFKLYRKAMLSSLEIESDGGFEIGMEIVAKAYISGFKIAEVPCVWTDRQAGESRFKVIKWMPKYLKWYFHAMRGSLSLFYILALIPPLYILYLANRYAINVPFWDQWELVPLLKKAFVNELTFSDIWAQHNEHRIFFPLLIMLPTALLTKWNILYEISINIALAGATFFFISSLLRLSFDGTIHKWLLLLSSLLIFSTAQWENWTWGWQIQIFLNVLGCVAAVWAVSRWPAQWRGVIIGIVFSTISSFSFNNGLLTWIAVAVMMILQKERKFKYIISWLAAFIIVVFLYYYGYEKPGYHPSLLLPVKHPYDYMRYILAYLGSPLGFAKMNISILIGLVLLVTTCAGTVHIRRRDKEEYGRLLPWLALGLYALLSAAATGIGRLGFGVDSALASRYTTFSTLFVLCSLVVASSWIKCSLKNHQCLPNKTTAFVSSLSTLIILSYVLSFSHGTKELINRSKSLETGGQCLVSIQTASDECLKIVYPDATVVRERVKMLREMNMSVYASRIGR